MIKIQCHYGSQFYEIAGKYRETIEIEGNRLTDLVALLNKRYEGFKEELLDPVTGEILTRNGILLQSGEENTKAIFLLNTDLRNGDILTFY